MNRNVKKLIAFGLVLGSLCGYSYPVYAAENSSAASSEVKNQNKAVISIDDAVDGAIKNSYKIAVNQKKIDMLKDKKDFYKDLREDDDYSSLKDIIDDLNDLAKIQYSSEETNLDFLKDKIAKNVTQSYNSLVLAEKELDALNQNISVTAIDLENTKLKKQTGVAIQTDVDSADVDLTKLQNQKKSKQQLIDSKKEILTIITGKDFDKYSIEDTIKYNPLVINGSLDDYLDEKIDKETFYIKRMVEYTDDHCDDTNKKPDKPSKDDYTKSVKQEDASYKTEFDTKGYAAAISNYLAGYGTYLENQYSNDTSSDSYKDAKRTLKTSLLDLYSTLKDTETQIDTLKKQIYLTKKQMDNLKVTCDAGLKPTQDYNRSVLNVKNLELSLEKTIDGYNTLKTGIEQPWTVQ